MDRLDELMADLGHYDDSIQRQQLEQANYSSPTDNSTSWYDYPIDFGKGILGGIGGIFEGLYNLASNYQEEQMKNLEAYGVQDIRSPEAISQANALASGLHSLSSLSPQSQYSLLEDPGDFIADPAGLAGSMGNLVGSMVVTGGVGGLTRAGLGKVAASVADRAGIGLGEGVLGTALKYTPTLGASTAMGIVDAGSEAGQTKMQALQMGDDIDTANQKASQNFWDNIGYSVATSALDLRALGKAGRSLGLLDNSADDAGKGLLGAIANFGDKVGASKVASLSRRVDAFADNHFLPRFAGNIMTTTVPEAYQEGLQNEFQDSALTGDEVNFNPWNMSPESREQMAVAALGMIPLAGVGSLGGARRTLSDMGTELPETAPTESTPTPASNATTEPTVQQGETPAPMDDEMSVEDMKAMETQPVQQTTEGQIVDPNAVSEADFNNRVETLMNNPSETDIAERNLYSNGDESGYAYNQALANAVLEGLDYNPVTDTLTQKNRDDLVGHIIRSPQFPTLTSQEDVAPVMEILAQRQKDYASRTQAQQLMQQMQDVGVTPEQAWIDNANKPIPDSNYFAAQQQAIADQVAANQQTHEENVAKASELIAKDIQEKGTKSDFYVDPSTRKMSAEGMTRMKNLGVSPSDKPVWKVTQTESRTAKKAYVAKQKQADAALREEATQSFLKEGKNSPFYTPNGKVEGLKTEFRKQLLARVDGQMSKGLTNIIISRSRRLDQEELKQQERTKKEADKQAKAQKSTADLVAKIRAFNGEKETYGITADEASILGNEKPSDRARVFGASTRERARRAKVAKQEEAVGLIGQGRENLRDIKIADDPIIQTMASHAKDAAGAIAEAQHVRDHFMQYNHGEFNKALRSFTAKFAKPQKAAAREAMVSYLNGMSQKTLNTERAINDINTKMGAKPETTAAEPMATTTTDTAPVTQTQETAPTSTQEIPAPQPQEETTTTTQEASIQEAPTQETPETSEQESQKQGKPQKSNQKQAEAIPSEWNTSKDIPQEAKTIMDTGTDDQKASLANRYRKVLSGKRTGTRSNMGVWLDPRGHQNLEAQAQALFPNDKKVQKEIGKINERGAARAIKKIQEAREKGEQIKGFTPEELQTIERNAKEFLAPHSSNQEVLSKNENATFDGVDFTGDKFTSIIDNVDTKSFSKMDEDSQEDYVASRVGGDHVPESWEIEDGKLKVSGYKYHSFNKDNGYTQTMPKYVWDKAQVNDKALFSYKENKKDGTVTATVKDPAGWDNNHYSKGGYTDETGHEGAKSTHASESMGLHPNVGSGVRHKQGERVWREGSQSSMGLGNEPSQRVPHGADDGRRIWKTRKGSQGGGWRNGRGDLGLRRSLGHFIGETPEGEISKQVGIQEETPSRESSKKILDSSFRGMKIRQIQRVVGVLEKVQTKVMYRNSNRTEDGATINGEYSDPLGIIVLYKPSETSKGRELLHESVHALIRVATTKDRDASGKYIKGSLRGKRLIDKAVQRISEDAGNQVGGFAYCMKKIQGEGDGNLLLGKILENMVYSGKQREVFEFISSVNSERKENKKAEIAYRENLNTTATDEIIVAKVIDDINTKGESKLLDDILQEITESDIQKTQKEQQALREELSLQDVSTTINFVEGKEQVTYHAGLAKFKKFDLKFLGTGEGQQVHGYGMYTAQKEEVALYRYKKRLQLWNATIRTPEGDWKRDSRELRFVNQETGEVLDRNSSGDDGILYLALSKLYHNSEIDIAIGQTNKMQASPDSKELTQNAKRGIKVSLEAGMKITAKKIEKDPSRKEYYQNSTQLRVLQKAWELINNKDFAITLAPGYMYRVGIPSPKMYLDESIKLKDQPKFIQEATHKVLEGIRKKAKYSTPDFVKLARQSLRYDNDLLEDYDPTTQDPFTVTDIINLLATLAKEEYKGVPNHPQSNKMMERMIQYNRNRPDGERVSENDVRATLKAVEKAAKRIVKEVPYQDYLLNPSIEGELTGRNIQQILGDRAKEEGISKSGLRQKYTSEQLAKVGIKGYTYEGGMDGRCFVTFNPEEDMRIMQRYSKTLPQTQGAHYSKSPQGNSNPESYEKKSPKEAAEQQIKDAGIRTPEEISKDAYLYGQLEALTDKAVTKSTDELGALTKEFDTPREVFKRYLPEAMHIYDLAVEATRKMRRTLTEYNKLYRDVFESLNKTQRDALDRMVLFADDIQRDPIQVIPLPNGANLVLKYGGYYEQFRDNKEAVIRMNELRQSGEFRHVGNAIGQDGDGKRVTIVYGLDEGSKMFRSKKSAEAYAKSQHNETIRQALSELDGKNYTLGQTNPIAEAFTKYRDLMNKVEQDGYDASGRDLRVKHLMGYFPHIHLPYVVYQQNKNGDWEKIDSFHNASEAARLVKKLKKEGKNATFKEMTIMQKAFVNQFVGREDLLTKKQLARLEEEGGLSAVHDYDSMESHNKALKSLFNLFKDNDTGIAINKVLDTLHRIQNSKSKNKTTQLAQLQIKATGLVNKLQKVKKSKETITKAELNYIINNANMHYRFNPHFLKRMGGSGYNRNVREATYDYLVTMANYTSKEKFYEEATATYQDLFHQDITVETDNRLRKFLQQYVNAVARPQTITSLDNWMNGFFRDNKVFNSISQKLRGHGMGGHAYTDALRNAMMAQNYLKLGLFNPSSAGVQLAALLNTYAKVKEKKYFWKAMKDGFGRNAKNYQGLFDELGIGEDFPTLDKELVGKNPDFLEKKIIAGKSLKDAADKSMMFFKWGDEKARKVTAIAGYLRAKDKWVTLPKDIKEGLLKMETKKWEQAKETAKVRHREFTAPKPTMQSIKETYAIRAARNLVTDTQFDYSAANTPLIMTKMGQTGKLFLQFRKYPLFMAGMLLHSNWKQRAKLVVPLILLTGMAGIPGEEPIDKSIQALSKLLTDEPWSPNNELRKGLLLWAGNDPSKKAMANNIIYGLPAGLLGINLSGRIGLSDLIPSEGEALLGPTLGGAVDMATGRGVVRTLMPRVYAISQAVKGEYENTKGEVIAKNNDYERILKVLGFKPVSETNASDTRYVLGQYKKKYNEEKSKARQDYLANPTPENYDALRIYGMTPKEIKAMVKEAKKKNNQSPNAKGLVKKPRTEQDRQLKSLSDQADSYLK